MKIILPSFKWIALTGLCLLFAPFLQAQDTIALKAGVKIPAKNISIKGDTLFYHMEGSGDNSKYSKVMSWSVSYIRYANGTVQSFDNLVKPTSGQFLIKVGIGDVSESGFNEYSLVRFGYSVSAGYAGKKVGRKKQFGWEAALNYTEKGGLVQMNGMPISHVGSTWSLGDSYADYGLRLDYLSGEVLGRYYLSRFCYLKGGITMGYLVHYKGVTTGDLTAAFGPINDVYQISDFKRFAAGALGGAGLCKTLKKGGLFFELAYQYDFTALGIVAPPTPQGNAGDVYHSRTMLLNIGMYFNLIAK